MVKHGNVKRWKYEECDVRDDVKLALPEGWSLRVFRVQSGDSGEKYYVQIMQTRHSPQPICLCDCMQGKFLAPLSILGLGEPCKHGSNLLAFLKNGDA
jgi:hypothetical protein